MLSFRLGSLSVALDKDVMCEESLLSYYNLLVSHNGCML